MSTWRVGKTMVGFGKPAADVVADTERRAKYKLGQVIRQTVANYQLVAAPGDPFRWAGPLAELEMLATRLERGEEWPVSMHGMNWVWSLPWGAEDTADRDLWVFWAKVEGGDDGADEGVGRLTPSPRGGAVRELAGSGVAA